jgi:hypothetical protein
MPWCFITTWVIILLHIYTIAVAEPSSFSLTDSVGVGVLGGADGDGEDVFVLGGSRVISKQPHLMCVHRLRRIPAITPTTADAHAPITSVRSVALYGMDGGGLAIFLYTCFIFKVYRPTPNTI